MSRPTSSTSLRSNWRMSQNCLLLPMTTGGWLPLLCTMNVTLVTEQFRTLFGWDHAALEQAVGAAPPGAGGLALLPYFDGERTPNLPHSTGVLAGLNRQTLSPGGLARAAMEGVTFNMHYGLRRLAALGR